jgi:hypothetical protein
MDVHLLSAIIGAAATVGVLAVTLLTKNIVETRVLSSKLETEHNFEQRKKIKEVLSKYKVQLLDACEDLSHRMNNFADNSGGEKMQMNKRYVEEKYYFHSFAYRILTVYGWIKKIQNEMFYLDTTLASKNDLDFIKFLKLFPRAFCNLSVVDARQSDFKEQDSFTRNKFELLPDCIITETGVKSYSEFIKNLPAIESELIALFQFLDGVTSDEKRLRWHRLRLLQVVLAVFLNNYGYSFQRTSKKQMEKVISKPSVTPYLKNYRRFFKKYELDGNQEVREFLEISRKYYPAQAESAKAE